MKAVATALHALLLHALLMVTLCIGWSIANAAEIAPELGDGWHSWDVPAGSDGKRACCYYVRQGHVGTERCRLGNGSGGLMIDEDCMPTTDTLRVYVLVVDGDVSEIRALSSTCPVTTSTPVQSMGERDGKESVAWLDRYARDGSRLADEAVTSIALHEEETSFTALAAMVEDQGRGMDVRQQALFWIAQSDSEAAFDYLDRLLGAR